MTTPARTAPPRTFTALFGALIGTAEKLSAASGLLRPAVRAVQRDLHLAVVAVTPEAEEVISLTLAAAEGTPLPRWRPGCHIDLVLPSGRVRQYSLCGDPADRGVYRIAVRRIPDGGGGSLEAHTLRPGDRVIVRGPRNAFPFIAAPAYLFVAGGIGITPILPMVRQAAGHGADWQLVYTGRTRASMPFLDELSALDADRVHVWPDDERGVPDAATILALSPADAQLYVCGPPPMITAIRSEPVTALHYERFSPAPIVGGAPFDLLLGGSGETVHVAADESALTALRRVRPAIAYSCQNGFCGTCVVRYTVGTVEHHDRCLPEAARQNQMAICVSRGVGTVALDL